MRNQRDTTVRETHTDGGILDVSLSRRRFFIGSGAVAAIVVLAACGDDEPDVADPVSPTTDVGADAQSGDLQIARTAASLEVLAVDAYKRVGDAAAAGKLGTVPSAVGEYVQAALSHHQAHLDAWNKVITGADGAVVTEPNAKLKPTVDAEFGKVKDVVAAAELALMLERIAADTYLKAVPILMSDDAVKLAASIQTVDRQHQSILLYALGKYPVPETFQTVEQAAF